MNRTVYSRWVAFCMLVMGMLWQTSAFAQSACSAPVTRQVTNAKSTNSNQWDDFGMLLTGIMSDNTPAAWLFQSGTTFVENTDGTARLSGTIAQFGNSNRRFNVVLNLTAQTFTPRAGSPYVNYGQNTTGWYYYQWGSATLTGVGDLAGASVTLARNGHDFQIGIGGDDQPEPLDQAALGGSGWFLWTVVSQPSAGGVTLLAQQPGATADFNFLLSGTIAQPCGGGGSTCDNVTAGGEIAVTCSNGQVVLGSTSLPSGGSGAIEYLWFSSTTGCGLVTPIPNSNSATLNIGSVSVTTTYIRCSRRAGCPNYPGESNCVTVTPTQCNTPPVCDNVTAGGTISVACNNGQVVLGSTSLPSGGSGAIEYLWFSSTTGCGLVNAIPNSNSPTLNIGSVSVTTTYIRCSRRAGCPNYPGESNCVTVTPTQCNTGGGGTCRRYSAINTNDICGSGSWQPYVMYLNINGQGVFFQAATMNFEVNGTTATLSGNLYDPRTWQFVPVNVTYTGGTSTPPVGSPKYELCLQTGASTTGWTYFTGMSGTVVLGGQTLTVTRRGEAFQVGTGANLQNVSDLGASGWFTLSNGIEGDFNFKMTGETNCGTTDPCATDAVNPVISGCPSNISLTTSGTTAVANYTAPTATDNCGTPTVTRTAGLASGSQFPLGTTTVTYTATDARGNNATCSFTVTVTQVQTCNNVTSGGTIVAACSNGQTVINSTTPASGGAGTLEYIWLRSTTGCPTALTDQVASATSETLTVGNVTVTTYFRRCARRAGCSAWVGESNCVTITPNQCDPCATDAVAPVIAGCPSNISLTTSGTTAVANYTAPTATDNCGTPTVTRTEGFASGSAFPLGVTRVTYTATDARGNRATCSFTVTVIQVQTCNNVTTGGTIVAACSNGQTVINNVTVASGGAGTLEYIWLRSTTGCPGALTDQIANATSETLMVGNVTVTTYFRRCARRAGCSAYVGESNCVTITPNQCNPCATDAVAPVIAGCPSNISLTTTGTTAVGTYTAPTATDNCGTPTVTRTEGLASGSAFPVGVTRVTYTATDARGNRATCSFTVTVTQTNTCGNAISVRPVTNTRTNCNTGSNYVMLYNNVLYTAGTNLKFTEYSDGTARLAGNVHANGNTYAVNVTFSGRACTSSGSPKLGDGNGVCGASGMNTTNWYYYTTTTGTIGTTGGTVNIARTGPAFQVGQFANLQQNVMGASGWFTNSGGSVQGDFNINLGTCESCCSNPTVIACNNPPANCGPLGTLLRQIWNNNTDWTFPIVIPNRAPDATSHINTPQTTSRGDNYVQQIRGYIHPTVSGNYQFNIYGDDNVELFFAQNDNPSNKFRVASIHGWTNEHEWHKYSTQLSGTYHLTAGQRYYIEIRHKEGSGGDHVGLRWKLPNGTWEIIPSARLSPYCPSANSWNANASIATIRLDGAAEPLRARLNWLNNTGYKNDYFVVQKFDNSGTFQDVEHIDARPEDRNQNMNSFVAYDVKPDEGENYYRIKVVYEDGNSAVSDIKTIKFGNVNDVNVFPNPADDIVNLTMKQYEGQAVTIKIYDQLGQQVKQVQVEKVGSGALEIDLTDLEAGQYTVQIAAEGRRSVVRKFQLMR